MLKLHQLRRFEARLEERDAPLPVPKPSREKPSHPGPGVELVVDEETGEEYWRRVAPR